MLQNKSFRHRSEPTSNHFVVSLFDESWGQRYHHPDGLVIFLSQQHVCQGLWVCLILLKDLSCPPLKHQIALKRVASQLLSEKLTQDWVTSVYTRFIPGRGLLGAYYKESLLFSINQLLGSTVNLQKRIAVLRRQL